MRGKGTVRGHRAMVDCCSAICSVVVASAIFAGASSASIFSTKVKKVPSPRAGSAPVRNVGATQTLPQSNGRAPAFNSPLSYSVSGSTFGDVGLGGMYSMAHADFNGDGIPDLASVGLYCARPNNGTAAIFLGKGDGTFNAPMYTPAGQCPGVIHTAQLRG